MNESTSQKRESPGRAWWIAMCLASVALVLCVVTVPWVPSNDGPQHIMLGSIENSVDALNPAIAEQIEFHQPITSNGYRWIFRPLEHAFGWRAAHSVTLSILALIFAWSFAALVLSLERRRAWLALVGFGLAFGWTFWMGFYSFYLATSLGMLVCAAEVRPNGSLLVRRFVVAALLFIQALTHVFAAALTGPIVVALAATRAPEGAAMRERAVSALSAVLAGLPALLIAALVASTAADQPYAVHEDAYFRHPPLQRLELAATASLSGPLFRGGLAVIIALVAAGTTLVQARRRHAPELVLAAACLAYAVAFWLAPYSFPGWQGFSPRFLPWVLIAGMTLVPIEQSRRFQKALSAALIALSALWLGWAGWFHHHASRQCAPALEALEADIERTDWVLFVPLRSCFGGSAIEDTPWVPYASFLTHAAGLFAAEQGGIAPSFNGSREIHPFTVHPRPDTAIPAGLGAGEWLLGLVQLAQPVANAEEEAMRASLEAGLFTFMTQRSSEFEHTVVAGPADERAHWNARGFRPVWEGDGSTLFAFEGCPIEFDVPAGWVGSGAVLVEMGWWPGQEPAFTGRLQRETAGRVEVPGAPCGEVWVRAFWDRDDSGALNAGDEVCAGPPPGQPIVIELERRTDSEPSVIDCTPLVAAGGAGAGTQ